jgi:hypothetical protein
MMGESKCVVWEGEVEVDYCWGIMGGGKCIVWGCEVEVVRDPPTRRGNRNPAPAG